MAQITLIRIKKRRSVTVVLAAPLNVPEPSLAKVSVCPDALAGNTRFHLRHVPSISRGWAETGFSKARGFSI